MSTPVVVKKTGRGKYQTGQNGPGDMTVQLSNFDINGSEVKEDHKAILRGTVIEILKAGGSIAILGHASTTGSTDYDQALGADRADQVLRFLRFEAGAGFFVNKIDSRGKATALALTGQDNKEDDQWRAVWIRVWTKNTPPPDLGQPIKPSTPLPVDPGISAFNDAINLAGGVLSIIDLGIDIAATYSAAAGLATAGTITGVGGLVLTVVGGIIGLPALWASTDALAEFNGKVQGYADAMQDMAEAFKDNGLDRKPVRDWPAIPKPEPHISGNLATSVAQKFWRQGQRKGCNQAYIDILEKQANPIEMDGKVNGKTRKIRVNGKVMLRAAWVSTKGEVSVAIIKLINEKLKAAGKPPFPTH
jgi:hypothetical protein